jgi:hypothetical protein
MRGSAAGGAWKISSSRLQPCSTTWILSLAVIWVLSLSRRYSRSFGYSLTRNRPPSGWNRGCTVTTARLTVSIRVANSMSRPRSSVSSPHLSPVSMAVSTSSCDCASGIAA